jgi:hypothetical protein
MVRGGSRIHAVAGRGSAVFFVFIFIPVRVASFRGEGGGCCGVRPLAPDSGRPGASSALLFFPLQRVLSY